MGGVSEEDALKTGEHAKANILGQINPGGSSSSTGSTFNKTTVSAASLIDGRMCAEWIDAIIPALVVFIAAKAGKLIKKADLLLTEKEKNTLAPVLYKCLEELQINFDSPWVALAITAGFIYGGKLVNATTEKPAAKPPTNSTDTGKVIKIPEDKLTKVAEDLEKEKLLHLKRVVDSWQPNEEEIEARGKSLRQSPRPGSPGRQKIINSLRSQRLKELLDKK